MNNNFLGLITRCKDEYFIKEFCDYYLSQGVDRIFILDDESNDKTIYKDVIKYEKVQIFFLDNVFKLTNSHQMSRVNQLYKKIKGNFKWMISVDVDEFINVRKNPDNTIRKELETTYKNVDCIKIPWIMMSSNRIKKSPSKILQGITYRWNHSKRHPNKTLIDKFRCRFNKIEVKCIFKTNKFNRIDVHHPDRPSNKNIIVVESVDNRKSKLNPFYPLLNEIKIKRANMLCYHYRIISVENCIRKIKNSVLYKKRKISLNDMLISDYPEIIDETLKIKSEKLNL